MRILFIGDIVGRPGRETVASLLPDLRAEHDPDFVIANGENAAAGLGLTEKTAGFLFDYGIDCLTSGNHIWAQKEALDYLSREPRVLRPANYPPGTPGAGFGVYSTGSGQRLAVINLMGRVFMDPMDDPFRTADQVLKELGEVDAILVDFHAEATSEKAALGRYLDGRVTAVIGTHTHVPTADETVFPGGTAFITDAGMVGPEESIIGVEIPISLHRFLTGIPMRFQVPNRGPCIFSAVMIESTRPQGLAESIRRLYLHYPPE
ncbi:MAG: TIGR00282 family metallophosphoesterase [candidate division WS1 bacterium]|jgi:metallophosphoesterase (TIGR00282 family)|nr:TIGR00282 family metallophosphoesterase [candidate division WS1 bacterium]